MGELPYMVVSLQQSDEQPHTHTHTHKNTYVQNPAWTKNAVIVEIRILLNIKNHWPLLKNKVKKKFS